MEKVSRLENREWKEVSIVITDDEGIRLLNQKHLASAEVTDVISFRYEPLPGEKNLLSGEIIVNAERAAAEGNKRKNWSTDKELALYIAHGCNHLSGEDDATESERQRMRRRELKWLRELPTGTIDSMLE